MSYIKVVDDAQADCAQIPMPADLIPAFAPEPDGLFAVWQPVFGEHEIATFPVHINGKEKEWAVKNTNRMGLKASRALALDQFRSADAFGFVAGARSGITILDIDSADENLVADAMGWQGETPFVVRTRSGGHHLWYAYDGETGRHIKPWEGTPFDQLASGLVVAPPSKGSDGIYQIVSGSLDDLPTLPAMRHPYSPPERAHVETVGEGQRNSVLFRFALEEARHCDTFGDLLECAMDRNGVFVPPLPDHEVLKVTKSAWGYEERGENLTAEHGAIMSQRQISRHMSDPHVLSLLLWLKAEEGPDSEFMVADGLGAKLGWPRRKFTDARRALIDQQYLVPQNLPWPGRPVMYRWGPARLQDRK